MHIAPSRWPHCDPRVCRGSQSHRMQSVEVSGAMPTKGGRHPTPQLTVAHPGEMPGPHPPQRCYGAVPPRTCPTSHALGFGAPGVGNHVLRRPRPQAKPMLRQAQLHPRLLPKLAHSSSFEGVRIPPLSPSHLRANIPRRPSNPCKATPTCTAHPPVPGSPCQWSRPSSKRAFVHSMLKKTSYDTLAMALSIRESKESHHTPAMT